MCAKKRRKKKKTTPTADTPRPMSFAELTEALLDETRLLPIQVHYRLSGLEGEEAARLKELWPRISLRRRRALLEELEVLTEEDLTLSYIAVGLAALDDADAQVRRLGIRLLWEEEEPSLAERFLRLLAADPDEEVRATAAGALGSFVYLGEIEELDPALFARIRDALLAAARDTSQPEGVRRRALEAVSFATHAEVPDLITWAYAQESEDWRVSALFAMGRHGARQWHPLVLRHLEDPNARLRAEAATAAGQMELSEAVPTLMALLRDPVPEVRMAAAWALSEIGQGGGKVQRALEEALELTDDKEERAFLLDALDNFAFNAGLQEMLLLDVEEAPWDEDDLDDWLIEDFGFADEEDEEDL